ncbi:MAG TPA: pilus assembly protein N-terminal domain-containing protein, partial [Alphaproteobacteria bacterium]|nr:pilus assembly protein N-terminal domain-containing protein [Alphaproteobacteria bacterium]
MTLLSTDLSGRFRAGLALAALSLCLIGTGVARAAPGGALFLNFGKAEILSLDGDVADIMIANPSVVEASAVQSNKLYLAGAAVGDTNVIVLDAQGNILKKLDVHVRYDVKAIQELVDHLFPKEHVVVKSIHDQIILSGRVSSPAVASKVAQTVGHYVSDLQDSDDPVDEQINNMLEVAGEQQVMLRVKIIEASRSVLKELGLESSMNDPSEIATTTLFGRTPYS